jgi:small conductance mechanosensitive channel
MKKISRTKYADKKKKTIIALLKNIIKYLIMIFVVLAILSVYGVDTSSIITSIGVAGVIIGLALQDIVSDFLAGVLILFDNHYAIGDVVTIDGFTGEVINFGLMTTKIRAASGEIMILSNSSFKKVINYNMNNTTHYINIDVAYDTDINKLEKCLNEMKEEVEKISGYIGNYKLLGIQEFASSSIKYMIMLECVNSQRFQVKRDFNMILKRYLDKYKIEIPYTKVDVNIRGKYE